MGNGLKNWWHEHAYRVLLEDGSLGTSNGSPQLRWKLAKAYLLDAFVTIIGHPWGWSGCSSTKVCEEIIREGIELRRKNYVEVKPLTDEENLQLYKDTYYK